jgi:hypothetical protein
MTKELSVEEVHKRFFKRYFKRYMASERAVTAEEYRRQKEGREPMTEAEYRACVRNISDTIRNSVVQKES